jgi:hypothetical protein
LLLLHRSGLSPHTPCQSPGALTRVAACTLALSPIRDTLIEGFSHFVTSMTAPIASGWSCRVGLAPTGKRRLCTAHTQRGRSSIAAENIPGATLMLLHRVIIGNLPQYLFWKGEKHECICSARWVSALACSTRMSASATGLCLPLSLIGHTLQPIANRAEHPRRAGRKPGR